jgi:predicted lipid-binding transport protein (Tim44 family)
VRLERLGKNLAVHFGETVAPHWVDELVAEASASGSSGAAFESSVIAYEMEDVVHAWTGEPYSAF